MARPRAATDEQIIEAAEQLAAEKGWQAVYAKAVHDRLGVGGSLSTFTTVVNAWRTEKEEAAGDEEKPSNAEIVEDRTTIIDESLSNVASVLKSMRDAVTCEIDRAVADERKKSDRMRADERDLHQVQVLELRQSNEALTSENDGLAAEAQEEAKRADTAEDKVSEMDAMLTMHVAKIEKQEIQIKDSVANNEALKAEITALEAAAKEQKAASEMAVQKAEDRESAAITAQQKAEVRIEEVRKDLKSGTADLETARADLATERAKSSQMKSKLDEQQKVINEYDVKVKSLEAKIEKEKERTDKAWSRVEDLASQIQKMSPA